MKIKKYVVLLDSRVDNASIIEILSKDEISWWENHVDYFEIVEILDIVDYNVLKHVKMLKHVEKNLEKLIDYTNMHENDECYHNLYSTTKEYEKIVNKHREMTRNAIKNIGMTNSVYNLDDIDIKEI